MRLLYEIAIFQTVKSKVIISLFETVRLLVSISLRNLFNSLNNIKETIVFLALNSASYLVQALSNLSTTVSSAPPFSIRGQKLFIANLSSMFFQIIRHDFFRGKSEGDE